MAESARAERNQVVGPAAALPSARLPEQRVAADPWSFTLSLMLVAILPRLFVAIAWGREPVWDGHYYHFGATRIAEGLGYSEDVVINGIATWKPWCHYPVGYSGFLGLLYKVFGSSLLVAPIANAVVGALTVGVVHRLALQYLSAPRARLAAVLCAVHPGLILYTALVMTEALSAFGVALAGLLALSFRSPKGAALAGIVLGLTALVRPTALLAVPLMLLVFWSARVGSSFWQKLKRPVFCTALSGVCALLVIAPWTIRNCRTMDGCALISTNGGWNLAIGAITETGRFVTLTAEDGCPVVTGQVQQDRCWAKVGRDRILEDPARWLSLIPQKLAHTYNHESFAVGYLAEADPQSWPEPRKQRARSTLTLFHHLLMLAAAFSVVSWIPPRRLARRAGTTPEERWTPAQLLANVALLGFTVYALGDPEHPLFWLIVLAPILVALRLPGAPRSGPAAHWLWGVIFMTSLTHALFFGDDRYHITISPLLCVLAAGMLRRPGAPSDSQTPASPPSTPDPDHAPVAPS